MCLFTHFAAGALAGGLTGNVWLGAAAGAASHAALDAIPHYDHPDWRLELAGGVLSLVLLLFMPFVTWPAIVGGVFGMVPDLENLFQKLGKMRRDQFLFPSHTGLIPHGRTLGPRSLVWQVAIFVGCFFLLGLVNPAAASAAGGMHASPVLGEPVVRVLSTDSNRTRIEVLNPVEQSPTSWDDVLPENVRWGRRMTYLEQEDGSVEILPPRVSLVLAVPTTAPIQARIVELDWWKEPAGGEKALPQVEFGLPGIYRHVPLTGAEVPLGVRDGILRRMVLEIPHTPAGQAVRQLQRASGDAADKVREDFPLLPAGILNPDLFYDLQAGGLALMNEEKSADGARDTGLFGLTDNWLRLEIDETGLFRLTGQELSNMGLNLGEVDPSKLRLYRGGALALDEDPEVGEAVQMEAVGLNEVAIQLIGGQDGEWNLDDEIRFYGFPSDFWLDRVDPQARHLSFYNHPWENHGIYWLTWENLTTPSALPGDPARVSEVAAAANGGQELGMARMRRHFENQTYDMSGAVQDHWVWEDNINSSITRSFSLTAPLADSLATIVTDVRGNVLHGANQNYVYGAEVFANGSSSEAASASFSGYDQQDSLRVRVVGQSASLVDGSNSLTVRATNPLRTYPLMLDSFDILYWSELDLTRHAGQLEIVHWREQVEQDGQAIELKVTVPTSGSYIVWDVTDPREARILQPDAAPGELTCGIVRQMAEDRHFLVTATTDLHRVVSGTLPTVADLRSAPVDAHYITIYHRNFESAALRLTDFRSAKLPGVASPVARAVLVDDIYANFSGGQKDAYALRNYLQHVFEQGGGNLRYVCIVGNTTKDPRNYKGQDPASALVDLVPSINKDFFPYKNPYQSYSYYPFGTDDPLVSFDTPDSYLSLDVPEVALGRLPAVTVHEAEGLVDRMIAYASEPADGLWRNRFVFVADDGTVPSYIYYPEPSSSEEQHIAQAEDLSNDYVPASIDMVKIYGHTYDLPPGSNVKPEMRTDINTALSSGASMWYYVGHGAENNLADEQVFQSEDISSLTNGMKRFVFVAFSCDVGVYNSTSRRSMAELFIAAEGGGAIGSICASQVSFISGNNVLSDAFFSAMFPEQSVPGEKSLGQTLLEAKVAMSTAYTRRNSQRFTLLSDPATFLPHAKDDLQFATDSVDTLRSGARQVVTLEEERDVLLGLGDTYYLRVQESAFDHGYIFSYSTIDSNGTDVRVPNWHTFVDNGSPVFEGSGTMDGSTLRVPFKVPAQLRYGDRARVRLIVDDGQTHHAANMELPAVREAVGGSNDLVGPNINLAFEDNRYRVKAGTELRATLTDTSSIAILSTTPGNSILLEFDGTGFMTNVTRSFNFDANSYQTGSLSFPLPGDLPMGAHKAALFASDALGNVGNDTISFVIVPESVVGVEDVTLFPNPTPGPCRLLMELSDPMLMKWDIFTTAGRRIKTVEENLGAGPQILNWDGRDDQGDEIANGTYIYVLRGQVTAGGERDITKTGKLVIMR